jgi:hypothetical protein
MPELAYLTEKDGLVSLEVRVKPRSPRVFIQGIRNDRVMIQVSAPPEKGEANKAACKLVAKKLGVPMSAVEVASGDTARDKRLTIEGISLSDAEDRLGDLTEL